MNEPTKTELVYGDLCQLYLDINQKRRFPRIFRLAFELYIFKSQQLTDAMRSEYKAKTGSKWEASRYKGWNSFTNTLKKIRNSAIHGCPIVLNESVLCVYPNVDFSTDDVDKKTRNGKYRFSEGTSFIKSPFSENFESIAMGYPLKNKVTETPKDIKNYVFPIKEFVFYKLQWELLELKKDTTKRVDAVKLALLTFPVLRDYMKFYQSELKTNQYDTFKPDYWIKSTKGSGWVMNPKYNKGCAEI